ncbi:MAG TPA: amino acid adenylation domain-containing protein, partial [Thermoanaerobaculia bacterium]
MSEKSRNVDRLSPEQLQRLIDRLKPRGPKEDERRIGRQARDNGPIPLSFSQERIWFLDRLEPGNTALNMPGAVELDGPLHPAALSAAIEEITRRHESLRTTFTVAGGAPCQRISPPAPFPMPVADLSALPEASRESEADRWTAWHAVRRFDLESGPLLAVTLLRLGPGSHRLLLNMHHVVSDGWSVGVLVRELTTLYESFLQDRPSPLPEPPIQYADFAIWQHRALAAGQSRELDYWVERLGGEIAPLDFPTDRPRPAIQTFRGGRARLLLAPETAHRLRSFGQAQGATLFMTLLAGLDALLHRHSGQEDILVGSPIAGRRLVETEGLIGIFLNTLVLRTDLSGAPSFRALLERVREVTLGAYSNQDVPFEALLARLQPDRDLSRTPFFQVLLNVLNFPGSETRVAGLTVRAVSMPEVSSKFDMTFYVDEGEHGIRLDLVYNADLFDAARIEDFLSQLGSFFAQVLERPDEPVGRLSLVTERSRAVLPDPEEPLDASWRGAIHELFIARALATPDRPAVVDREGIWSYSDLWKAGGRLASWLAARGVGRGEVVAIYAHRSAPVAPAVLGALEAGAAFTMLDPAYPAARLVEILRLAAPRAFVRLEAAGPLPAAVDAWLAESGCARVDLPGGGAAALIGRLGGVPAAPPRVEIGPGDAAVLGFTSGSTGTPKGIVGRHGPLTHFLPWQCERFGLTFGDRFSLLSGLAHDPLQRDLFTPLYLGGTIVVPDPEDFAVPGRLAEWLARERVSVAHLTPAMAQILTELPAGGGAIEAPDLRLVLLVGDALTRLDVTRIRRLAPNVTCVNLYGSTETQRAVAYHVVGDAGEEGERSKQVLPLGRGMRDVQLLVINREGLLAGVGEVGEIAVRSPHLARGYLGDETLTADRFRANPFTGLPDDRVYRTGDLGRYLPDGEVAFAGRADLQVKIRGFRIEPAEIEAALASQSGVREAVVVVREDRGEKRLVAYVVPEHEGAVAVAALRQVLRDRLPAYMVPAAFVLLERLPITPNGKVDRRALPAPAEDAETAHGYAAPETALEEGVAAVWRELLGVERIGRSDNFFDLGGHSLLGIRLLTRLRDSFGAELPVAALFESPTLAELAGRIEAAPQGMPEGGETPLVSLPREGDLPLSFSQERIWFLDQLQPGSAAYNIPSAIRLEGALDAAVLRRAIGELIRRHETLRTTFPSAEGGPVQRIAEPATAVLPVVDLSRLTEAREAEALRLVQEEAQQPFDLASGPLLRMALLRLGDREHLLLSTIHHIVADGWSLGVFARELTALYQAFAAGRPAPLSELPVQYADFASWQRNRLAGARLEELLTYWKDRLLPEPPVLELPVDRARPAVESHRGARLPLAVDRELTAALARLGRDRGATLFMTLLAGFTGLLTRYTGQEDIAVGTPIAGRTRAEVEGLIGVFINTLVLRGDLSGNPTFLELLGRVRATALEAYAHQDLPFEKLVEALQPERRLAYSPLFQVLFILQNLPAGEARTPGLTFRALDVHHGVSPFDLTLSMAEADGRLAGYLEYKTDLIEASTAERWLGHLGRLLAAAAAEPAGRLSDLPFLSEAERSQLLAWNDTAAEIPPACAHQLIAASAAGRPDAPVLTFEGECLAYGEIEARAARLAHRLRALGVGPEVLVGIAMERSPELLIATLGVWKAGGAYLPLDPSYPAERLAFTLRDSRAPVLITQSHLETSLPAHEARVLCLDRGSELPPEEGETALAADLGEDAGPDNLAYVIYTSGSTGRPKGVQITHGALVNFLLSMLREPGLTADDVLLAVTSLSFDIVALELYLPLLAGARLEMVSSEVAGDGPRLLARLRESGATIVQATPSTWRMLLEAGWEEGPALRRALCGGEALLPDLAARLLPRTEELWNVYGPTETTVWSTVLRVEGEPGGMVSIGRPIANTRVQVLDSHMRPCPLGIPGELWIGGLGVARGYLDRPELTADRFVPDPFSASPGARLYRTGDLARVLPDGRLDFLGRADQQVKIRGHRIELGEIEAALSLHPAVAQAAVVARDDWGDRRLVAYVAPVPGEDPRPESLRAFLRERLPEHMEPAAFVTLPSLPLTPNRKVDRKALPAPEMTAAAGAYVAPRNSLEEILAHVWAEVLRIERAGIDDDFFALGGHSLLAARIVSRLGRVLGAPPPVRWLFERPTVRGLAARIASERGQDAVPDAPPITPVSRESAELPLSFSQQRLWFLDRLEPENSGYNVPAVLRLQGQLDVAALAAALAGIVRRHEVLRTTFPEVDGWPRQEIARPPAVLVPSIVDLADLPAEVRERELTWRAAAEARRPFDLMRGPLLRTLLLRLGESDHVLALTAHHIVCDAWSFAIFIRELSSLYTAAVRGEAPQLPALPVQYADFAAWQRDWLRGEVVDRLVEAWRSRLAGAPAGIELPTDRPYPPVQTFRGGSLRFQIEEATAAGLPALARAEGATLFMAVLGAFQTLLHRYSGQDDVVVGSPIHGRTRPELEELIGLFINTLALRGNLAGDPGFRELLARAREAALDAFALQELPFERLIEELQPPRDLARPPLFQVMLILQNAPAETLELSGLTLSPLSTETGTAKFELLLTLIETGGGLAGSLEYNADLFDRSTAERLLRHFETLLAGAVADPAQRLSDLPMLSYTEQDQILRVWNATAAVFPELPVHRLFERQAALSPEAPALVAGDERLTYTELSLRANRLAHHLRRMGVGPEILVGVSLERSADLVVTLLGILKAGGAYLPLDPTYPRERLRMVLEDAGASVLLTSRELAGSLFADAPGTTQVVCLDAEEAVAFESGADPEGGAGADNLAYALFTSGSTGRPKGVAVPHRALVNFLASMGQAPGIEAGERLLAVTSLSFDIAALEIFLPLLAGGCVELATREQAADGAWLASRLAAEASPKIRVLQATPSTWRMLLDAGWQGDLDLKALCGGEALPRDLASALRERVGELWNLYGPTETTVWSAAASLARGETGSVTIGRPIANTRIYLLDRHLRPVPPSAAGRLHIGGAGVARGYLGRPDLTAERFVPDPIPLLHGGEAGARLYDTGDLARLRPDGTLEFLDRVDHQVKVRGFRIELGEIEAALARHPAVAQTVVLARTDRGSDARLVAYLVAMPGEAPKPEELRAFLREGLPEYMLPTAFVVLDAFPLTPNGKVDRKALPAPEITSPAREYVAPGSPVEEAMAALWAEVLGLERVGANDNFFELGGH